MDWRILQIADVAFPTGGFTLSGGLEAAAKLGEVRDEAEIRGFLESSLSQTARGGLPLLERAYDSPEKFGEINGLCQAFLVNPAANRASRLQGSAFLVACEKAFDLCLGVLREKADPEDGLHFAPVFGFAAARLGISKDESRRLFVFLGLRDLFSAAVRLGLLGTYQAQRLQAGLSRKLDEALAEPGDGEPVQTSPLLDMFQGAHDRLEARLFQS
jgi:urease accessory protein